MPSNPQGFAVLAFSPTGTPLALPTTALQGATLTKTAYGGMDTASVALSGSLRDYAHIPNGARLDVWHGGERIFRYFVVSRTRELSDPEKTTLSGYGRVFTTTTIRITRQFVYSETKPADIATVFEAIATGYVTSRIPFLTLDLPEEGTEAFEVSSLDYRGRTVKEAFDALVRLTGGTWVWGFDVAPDGSDRLYLRPADSLSAPARYSVPVPGVGITAGQGEEDTADLVNRLHLSGGEQEYPNRIAGGDFEEPSSAGDDADNLILNPSFESGTSQFASDDWDLGGDASFKENGGDEPDALDGSWVAEIDDIGEYVEQTRDCLVFEGDRYRFRFYARPESATDLDDAPQIKAAVYWQLDGGGESIATIDGVDGYVFALIDQAKWRRFGATFDPAPADVVGIRVKLEGDNVGTWSTSDGGVLLDSLSLVDVDRLNQPKWTIDQTDGVLSDVDWAHTAEAKHGGYSVKVGVDTPDIRLIHAEGGECVAGETFLLSWWIKNPVGAGDPGNFAIGIEHRNGENGVVETDETANANPIAVLEEWVLYQQITTAPVGTARAFPFVRFTEAGEYLIDAVTMRDYDADSVTAEKPYITDGNLSLILDAADLVTEEENEAVHNSATLYGIREGAESAESITNNADAETFARAYFAVFAVPIFRVPVSDARGINPYEPGQSVRLIGPEGEVLCFAQSLPIAKLTTSINGAGLRVDALEVGREEVSFDSLLTQLGLG